MPTRAGDRYVCFIVVRADQGYHGPYGMRRRWPVYVCEDCGYRIEGDFDAWARKRMADHHACGHAPCDACGQLLLRRMDGTPRQHAHNRCPGKNPGHKIEREFVKNMTAREYS